MADEDEYGTELADFRKRVAELRATRALPGGGGRPISMPLFSNFSMSLICCGRAMNV